MTNKKKKLEFAKLILAAYAVACIVWISANYYFAFMEKQDINTSVTNTIVISLAVTILGYYSKSIGEKHSRNVNHVDENGVPYDMREEYPHE